MITKNKMDDIKARYIGAKTEKEREAAWTEMVRVIDDNPTAAAGAVLSQMRETNERAQDYLLKTQLGAILPAISLAYVAKTYFGKSRSWLHQRVNGNLVNGVPAKFTAEDLETLDYALKDLSAKLAKIRVQ